jgi:hypothetical protein
MKFIRNFPLIATALLGFIGYLFFKTSNFVNKGVESKIVAVQDTLAKNVGDSLAATAPAGLLDTLSDAASAAASTASAAASTASIAADAKVTKLENESPKHSSETKKNDDSAPKTDAKSASKTEHKSAEKADAKKKTAVKAKPLTEKSAVNATATPSNPKATPPKSGAVAAPKEGVEPRFHVIIGSYEKEVNATAKAAAFLKLTKKKATIVKQGGFFRVCADEFDAEQAAGEYAQKLKSAGEKSIIVKF